MSYHPDDMPRPQLRLHDWIFGAGGRRRLLQGIVRGKRAGWLEADLAELAGLHKKGSVDVHIRPLLQLGLLTRRGSRYYLEPRSPLVGPLRQLFRALNDLPDGDIDRPA